MLFAVSSASSLPPTPLQALINFQPDAADVPLLYTKDKGDAYDDTPGFGWVREDSLDDPTHVPLDVTANTFERELNADQRLDTGLAMQVPAADAAAWEYAVPAGSYLVTVAVGDPLSFESAETHRITVEGVNAIAGFSSTGADGSATRHQTASVVVDVSDGRLTIDAIGGTETKINYVDITNDIPPAAPTNLAAAAGDDRVDLDWDDNTDEDLGGYNVYRSTTPAVSATGSPLNSSLLSSSSYADTTAVNGTTYYYVVTSVDQAGHESLVSNEVTAEPQDVPPAAPTSLVATAGDAQVGLDWDDSTEHDLSGYDVYRSTVSPVDTSGSPLASPTGSAYTDLSASNGSTYYYVVLAVDEAANSSAASNEASATPADTDDPAIPQNLVATAGDSQVALDWDDNTDDTQRYRVYRSTSTPVSIAGAPLNATPLADSHFRDVTPVNGTAYHYVVTALDEGGNESAASSEKTATPHVALVQQVNFQSETAPVPAGYIRDFGQSFALRTGANQGSGLQYGWVAPGTITPRNLVGNGRDRNVVADQRLDTLMHMQGDSIPGFQGVQLPGAWELAVFNAAYTVDVSVGDASNIDSTHRISVEGQVAISGFVPTTVVKFASATRTVNVGDGRLTVDALGGTNTKINYVVIREGDTTAPAPPANLSATAGDSQVLLDWNNNSELDLGSYQIYRSTASPVSTSGAPLASVGSSVYTDTSAVNGITYHYVALAVDQAGNRSGVPLEVSATPGNAAPAAPANLIATPGDNQVTLNWDDNSELDLDGYNVYRSTISPVTATPGNLLTSVSGSGHTDSTAVNGTTYHYVVTALDTDDNESLASNEASATPADTTAPATPQNLVAAPGDNQVALNWDDNTDDTQSYRVYRSTTSPVNTSGSPLASPTGSSHTDLSAVNGTAYHYAVIAVDEATNPSGVSNEASAMPVHLVAMPAQINFQSETAPVPGGYVKDFGQGFDPTRGFGWVVPGTNVPTSLVGNGRDRNVHADQRLDTLMHMQLTPQGAWEAAVPNGSYTVTVSVGDPSFVDGTHRIRVEGVVAIAGFVPTAANHFANAQVTVSVADNRLTIDAIGGTNTKINYVDVSAAGNDTIAPAPPSNVGATGGDSSATVTWNANTEPDLAGYNVYRGTSLPVDTNGVPRNGVTPLTANSFFETGLTNGTTYHYVVEAVDTSGNKAASAPVSVTPNAAGAIDLKVNFQSETAPVPAGYLRDFGESYALRTGVNQGSGQSYGWVAPGTNTPVSLVGQGRDRNVHTDQRLDTLIHMQVAPQGGWEIAVPNGSYAVTVSVGDPSFTNSTHQINLEGQVTLSGFAPTSSNLFATATRTVDVADGRLTVDAIGGTNTKINYVHITSTVVAAQPTVRSTAPGDGATGVPRDAAVTAEVTLPNVGYGIDGNTLTAATVKLLRVSNNVQVPANLNTSGGGDVIVLQPTVLLDANTAYRFEVTNGLKDFAGASFVPHTSTFTTGALGGSTGGTVEFEKVPLQTATDKSFTSMVVGPDGKLYAGTIDGEIDRFAINPDGTLGTPEVISSLQSANGGPRMLIGLAFDPGSTPGNLILWVSHSIFAFNNAPDWGGKITRLSGPTLGTVQDYVVNLPRSIRDHITNSIEFGPDGKLYILQGSNTAMGAPDSAWGNRPERILSAALLKLDPALVSVPPLNAKTEEGGTYNPFAPGAALTLHATGLRNAFDMVWHSNGQLYVPTNGSAAGGNIPASTVPLPASCQNRIDDATNGDYTGPQVPGLTNVPVTHNDFLFRVAPGKYYGHPNPQRCEWVSNGGNPTSGSDPAQVPQYPVGTLPDRNWGGLSFDFGQHFSPNGALEYKSNVLSGALQGALLVARYSAGDDIIVLRPGSPNNDIVDFETGTEGLTGFTDPLDLVETPSNGNLYVSELGASKITLLRPVARVETGNLSPSASRLIYNDVAGGAASAEQTLIVSNSGDGPLVISGVTLAGANPSQFQITSHPALPATLPPGSTFPVGVRFNPTTAGPKGALLRIQSDDPDTPSTDVTLRGLGTLGQGGSNEPSLQWILDTYEIPVNVGDPDPTNSALPASAILGEEVSLQRFEKAGVGLVTIEPLGVFGPQGPSGTVALAGRYTSGSPASKQQLFSVDNSQFQSLAPQTSGALTFDPGTTQFGFYSTWPFFNNRDVFSEDALNTWETIVGNRHKVRVYPLKTAAGTTVANAYVVAFEETTSAYDYQDLVMIARNVKPAPAPAGNQELELENMDGVPFPDRLAFSRIGNLANPPAANGVHNLVTLRIKNLGTDPLSITGLPISGPWQLQTPPTLPATVPGSGQLDVQVKFVATAGNVHNGTLTVQSNDSDEPSTVVQLSGFWQSVSEGNQEPDVSEVVQVFGYGTTIVGPGQVLNQQGFVTAVGDEVLSPYWQRYDQSKPVSIRQLDAFHSCCAATAILRFHTKGSNTRTEVFRHLPADGQSLLPHKNTPPTDPAAGTFNHTGIFGLTVDNEWSDPTKNNQTTDQSNGCPGPCGHHVRFWPVRDRAGRLIPNTWLMAMDYSGINYDYNDNVYLISNIKPEIAAVDPNIPGYLPGAFPAVLDFDRTYAGTLTEKDGQTTGFQSTQRNKLDGTTPTNSYQPLLLDVNTTGQGTLAVTSTAGSNATNDNTQVNALQLGFDATAAKFNAGARLIGPLSQIANGSQQAGVMIGSDQDTFVKLVAIANAGSPAVQFSSELGGVATVHGSVVPIPNPATLQSLELALIGNPVLNTVQAAYRAISPGGDTGWVKLPATVAITGVNVGRLFGVQTKAGILTSHKTATQFTATFDRFAVTYGDPTAAPPAQQTLYRLDVAGPGNYVDGAGQTWTPDTGLFSPSNAIVEGGGSSQEILNTNDDVIYRTYRGNVGNVPISQRVLTYNLPISGTQLVNLRLHFAERFSGNNAPGKRVFDIEAEGKLLRDDLDIFSASGSTNSAVVLPIENIAVVDGSLTLVFRTVVDNVSIAGIEVLCCPALDTTPPGAPSGLTANGGPGGIALDWADNTESDWAGYNVYRSPTANGTYTKLNGAPLTTSAYNDTAAPVGQTSHYRVTALDSSTNESAPAQTSASRPTGTYDLKLSLGANRASPVSLEGTLVSGQAYVFTSPDTGVQQVSFFVDDTAMTHAARKVEGAAPFDLAGTAPNLTANPFDTFALTNGTHTLTVAINLSAGGTQVVTATFTVDNPVPSNFSTLSWLTKKPSPIVRTEAQGAVLDGRLYVFGGYTSFTPVTLSPRSDVYDPALDAWTQIANMPIATTHSPTVVDGRDIYFIGGYQEQPGGGQVLATTSVWKYNVDTQAWTAMPALPAARGAGGAALIGQDIHFFGGHDAARVDKGDHWVLSLNGGIMWTNAVAMPNPRNHLGGVTLGGKIYAVGGKYTDDAGARQTTVNVWDPANPSVWSTAASLPQPRSHILGSTFVMDGRIIVAGGDVATTNAAVNLVTAYNPSTNTWSALTPLPAARHSGVGANIGTLAVFTTGSLQATTYRGLPGP